MRSGREVATWIATLSKASSRCGRWLATDRSLRLPATVATPKIRDSGLLGKADSMQDHTVWWPATEAIVGAEGFEPSLWTV
jgi:hypothetical protein